MSELESRGGDGKGPKEVLDTYAFWLMPLILMLLAVGYIWITVDTLGADAGWLRILNDPGKNLFHFFLLPLAMHLLLKQFPPSDLWRIWTFFLRDKDARSHWLKWGLFLLILQVLIAFTLVLVEDDARGADKGKIQSPSQFADKTYRDALLALDQDLRRLIQLSTNATGYSTVSNGLTPKQAADIYRAAQYGDDPKYTDTLKMLDTFSETELKVLKENVIKAYTRLKELNGFTDMSARASYGQVLSSIGALCAIFIFLTALLAALVSKVNRNLGKDGYDYLYASVVVLIFWLGLRPYSEWYNSFYTIMIVDLYIHAMVLAGFTCLFCYFLSTKSSAINVAGILAVFSFLSALLAIMSSPMILEFFERVSSPWTTLVGLEILFVVGVLGIGAWFALEKRED